MQLQHSQLAPSPWVCRFAPLIAPGGAVLDLACGQGRHARYLAGMGYKVEAVDRDRAALGALAGVAGVETHCTDLEAQAWPYASGRFDGIVVTNYLYRPLLAGLLASLRPNGVLIYETFALGNEKLGRPSNPEFLLRPGELLQWLQNRLEIVAFEQGRVERPKPAVIQRVCAAGRGIDDCLLEPAG
jgi:SAM-dependent methyltransferase